MYSYRVLLSILRNGSTVDKEGQVKYMANTLVPRSLFPFNNVRIPSMWDEEDWDLMPTPAANTGNISLSEDDKHVYVDAAMPGVNPDEIDITYDKGMLWIRGVTMQEDTDKNKKYYQRASNSFSYRITLPTDIDENTEPAASCENGMLMLTFDKSKQAQPKKISVKGSSKNGNGHAKQARPKKTEE